MRTCQLVAVCRAASEIYGSGLRAASVLLIVAVAVGAQQPPMIAVEDDRRGEKLIAVVPFTGTGTVADPRRPLFAALRTSQGDRAAIQAFSYEVSDDGQFAIVQFSALEERAFERILTDGRVRKAFVRGKHNRAEVEAAIREYKKNFLLDPGGPAR